ncbi:MAG: hypothetical protein FD163_2146 [Hyphomonadaceae bacterium]|nr:MAG: hypothetical protein FD163_2146 [Hyphomonadaceae bacterium]
MKWSQIVGLAFLSSVFFCQAANAANAKATDPNSFVAALQAKGYVANIDSDAQADPMIITASGGLTVSIIFNGCERRSNCTYVEFVVSLKCDGVENECKAAIGNWQKEENFAGAVYLEEHKSLAMYHYMVTGVEGVSPDAVIGTIEYLMSDLRALESNIIALKPRR